MTEHEARVRHRLGQHTPLDEYIPHCVCGWVADPIKAGTKPQVNWDRAWARADKHVAEEAEAART